MQIAMVLAYPNGDYFQYSSFDEMQKFYQQIADKVLVSGYLGNKLNNIKTKPLFINMTVEYMKGRLYPMIYYVSQIDLKDAKSLKEENNLVNETLKLTLQGLTKMSDTVLYRVYNRNDNVNSYGFIKS